MQPSSLADPASVGKLFRKAVHTGNCSEVERLIDLYGLSYSRDLRNGYVLLRDAIKKNRSEIVQLLIKSGCRTEIKQGNGRYFDPFLPRPRHGREYGPLHIAVEQGNRELVSMLLVGGVKVDVKGVNNETPLHVAVRHGHARITEDLLNYKARVDSETSQKSNNNTSLHIVCKGNFEPNGCGCSGNEVEIADILIQHGADVNRCNRLRDRPITLAVHNSNFKLFSLLLSRGAIISYNPELLNIAVANASMDIATSLVQHGSSVNACDLYGRTPLHYACVQSTLSNCDIISEICQMLLNMGASVNAEDKYKSTPLHYATRSNLTETVEVLLEFNADVNVKDIDLRTPIHYAAALVSKEITKLLLVKRARVNGKFEDRVTPLHMASERCRVPEIPYSTDINCRGFDNLLVRLDIGLKVKDRECVVSYLLEHGSDVNLRNKSNRTALEEAAEKLVYFRRSTDGYYKNVKLLLATHVFKMKIANLYLNEGNLLLVEKIKDDELEKKCRDEISIMSNEIFLKVDDVNISYYDILTKKASMLARYLRFEHSDDIFNAYTKFPGYARLLKINFFKCILFGAGINFFNQISPKLPYDCIEVILSYLSFDDQKVFVSESVLLNFLNSPGFLLD